MIFPWQIHDHSRYSTPPSFCHIMLYKWQKQIITELVWKFLFYDGEKMVFDCSVEKWVILKLSRERSEQEKFEWYWHPKILLMPKFHDFSLIFKFHDFSMHGFSFSHFLCFREPVGTLITVISFWNLISIKCMFTYITVTVFRRKYWQSTQLCSWKQLNTWKLFV